MRVMALDVGDVRIGVAVSDPMKIIAQGLESIKRADPKKDVEAVSDLASEYEVEEIVVGLPKMMSGELGIQSQKVLNFVEALKAEIKIPIVLQDERLTTVSANKVLIQADMSRKKRKKVVDKMSAVIILQGYLDSSPKE